MSKYFKYFKKGPCPNISNILKSDHVQIFQKVTMSKYIKYFKK